ncbi:hypothetical protein BKA66DRAFT_607600 [Pyrenochaeta sp. MPI-SDFR-AT-0127]|nr:hypothetical protein BKA66DRAFT_607600 [Pyrenochaeta sp. MPI-SDFR-AT-0127]
MNMPAEDPWYWTVDDIVAELCHSLVLFEAAGCRAEHIPNSTTLESLFRERQMTGAIFLTAYDIHVPQRVLNVHQLEQQKALTSVLELLRRRSVTYKQQTANVVAESSDLRNAGSLSLSVTTADATFVHETGRKRRRVSLATAASPLTDAQKPPNNTTGSRADLVAEGVANIESQWDHLLRWQQVNGDEEVDLAALGESEDEEHFGLGDPAEEGPHDAPDDEGDIEKQAQDQSKLTSDRIVDIINERIEFYTASWKPNKGVIKGDELKYDPEAMWEEAEATGQRQQLVKRYEADLVYYRHRLDTLCDEIMKFPGSNADKVRRQCSNLEVTVDSMELAEWLLSIYRLEPLSDSAEELDDRIISLQHGQPRPSPISANHPQTSSMGIVDLGSPSESSEAEENVAMILDESMEPVTNATQDQNSHSHSIHMLDSIPMHPIERPISAREESYIVDGIKSSGYKTYFNDEPESASIASVSSWRWTDLVGSQDRKRIVSKAVNEMKTQDRELLRTRLSQVGKAGMTKELRACIEMLSKGESKMQGVLPRDLPKIVTFTRLFLSWWLCDNYFRVEPSQWHLEELLRCLEDDSPDPTTFYDYLVIIMSTTFNAEALKHPGFPSQAEIIEISDDDEMSSRGPATLRTTNLKKSHCLQQTSVIILD